jgi:hypothetical protein
MLIKITNEVPTTGNFISWQRLATELFPKGELQPGEHIVGFDVGERGINYFVSRKGGDNE